MSLYYVAITRRVRKPTLMKLYPETNAPTLAPTLFADPPAAYRGAPFWSWNTHLDRAQLLRQYAVLKVMGMGGFHIHPRTGLATPYLGEEFMGHVQAVVDQAQADGLRAWLYDEDRWPSGFAGGLVTVDPQYRAHHLLLTTRPYAGTAEAPSLISNAHGSRNENGTLLARFQVVLRNGVLAHYARLGDDEPVPTTGTLWYAYLEQAVPSPWWNNQTYVDTLNPAAIRRFIETTHERYAAVVGDQFGSTIPAIFTDEPQFVHKVLPRFAEDTRDLFLPWTPGLGDSYRRAYGIDPLDTLPEVLWELPDRQASLARYRYHDHVAECFASAFADTLGQWCAEHGLLLTGHMMEEPTLASQSTALGEAMRSYRSFQLPGIDMLCDWREYNTAKQAQSAAHQYDRPGVLSELYGVTNWDFTFVGHKAQGDWQAALGVTVRVHHLTWVSMAGEAKRDYPASIGEQSPWWREYRRIEDHFARLNTALTRGRPHVRIGVIHPIESYWLCSGPTDQTAIERAERERAFADLTHWLLFGLLDFDFIAESLLLGHGDEGTRGHGANAQFRVGAMAYDVVVVPGMRTMRVSTLERLTAFVAVGGRVIFAGEVPSLVDAQPSTAVQELAARATQVPWGEGRVLAALAPVREVQAQGRDGAPMRTLLHQLREDGDGRMLFLCNTDRSHGYDEVRLSLRGIWQITILDTLTGTMQPWPASYTADETLFTYDFPAHGSLLLQLTPGRGPSGADQMRAEWHEVARLSDPVSVTLDEPNVLLLNQAAYQLDDEPWQPIEEILRLDTALRTRLGWPLRMDALAQPWTTNYPPPEHTLRLRFTIAVDAPVERPTLALEAASEARMLLDGQLVLSIVTGWWVDEALQTVALPTLASGQHELQIEMPYGPQSNPEWCYLLGDFGVVVRGRHARIVAPVRELAWGDWTRQGLPFYAGNVTYHATYVADSAPLHLHVPQFAAPLLRVAVDGQALQPLAFAPFRCTLGAHEAGQQRVDITTYGNRFNAFGCLHNRNPDLIWYGPDCWRTVGEHWAYEYQLRPMGILSAPRLMRDRATNGA
jgi:hypothetical protein